MISRIIPLIFCLILFSVDSWSQEDRITDGRVEYWTPSQDHLFLIFHKKFWKDRLFDHASALQEHPLFIRLEDEHTKVSKLMENGYSETANELKAKLLERNKKVVEEIIDQYKSDNFYFYYAKDAERIFKENDYSYLWKDLSTKASDFSFGDKKAAYVLIYKQPATEHWNRKKFVMHIWDMEEVQRVRNWNFLEYKYWFSNKMSIPKTIRALVYKIWDE